MKTSREDRRSSRIGLVRKAVPFLLWAIVILACFLYRDEISVENILRYAPGNSWAAAAVMLLLFALKSLSVFIFGGILYAADGILFPLPVAVAVNLCGSAVMLPIPY